MLRRYALAMMAIAASLGHTAVATAHHPGCKSARCDHHVDRLWAASHKPKFRMTSFEICDANQESGAPEDPYNPTHIDWKMEENGYEGAFSWLPSTWDKQSKSFHGYPDNAVEATPEQQTLVFRRYKNVGEWPTMAKC